MTQPRIPGDNFEERARTLLKAEVAQRGAVEGLPATGTPVWLRRAPRLGLAGAAVAAIAAAVLIVNASGGDTPPAFAVESQPEGMVSVEIRSPEDPQGLERALDEVGVPASVTYLPAAMTCREPRFQAAAWPKGARAIVVGPPPGGAPRELANATVVGGPGGARAVIQEPEHGSGPATFWISRAAVGPGQTLVITASAGDEGIFGVGTPSQIALAEGTVSACEPVPAEPVSNGAGR